VESVRAGRDCLDAFRRRVTSAGILGRDELELIDTEVARLIEEAVAEAKAAPEPAPAELVTDVYVSYSD
jgi:pyruvate dehydrogenase E1 component alpha subunit